MAEIHVPVLVAEVLGLLAPRPGGRIFDGTVGAGGHAAAIAPLLVAGGAEGLYVGVDRDPEILNVARERLAPLGDAVRLAQGRFGEMLAADRGAWDGILLDVGVSSLQLDRAERGFSFGAEGPLDMRMDPTGDDDSAADLVNRLPEEELANVIYQYGEERLSRRIARAIVEARRRSRIETTTELAAIVERAVPRGYERGRIHPATRTFQALRIAVNDELSELERALDAAPAALAPGGRIAVIAFHSLEDRIVKNKLRDAAKAGRLRLLTKKPVEAGEAEVRANRRARSAKLRAAERAAP